MSARNESLLFEEPGTNQAIKFHAVRGDAAAAFKNAPYTRRESFRTQRHMALPMEPRGLLAEWDAARGRLTVSGGAKVLFFNRRTLAKQLGLAGGRRSRSSRTTSAAASARAASSIRRIF